MKELKLGPEFIISNFESEILLGKNRGQFNTAQSSFNEPMIKNLSNDLYAERPSGTLYHYTSLSGLEGILNTSSLWASDIRYLNDAAEMQHTAEVIRIEIAKRLESGSGNPTLLSQFKEWIFDRLENGHMLFVASFTANGNILSQWRGYCQHGKGVSLGVDSGFILDCATRQSFQIGKCIYDYDRQMQLASQIIASIERLAEQVGEADKSRRHPSQSFHDIFEAVESDILRIASLLKHPSFKEEDEWRVVSPVLTNYITSPICYREGHSMLVPYLEFKLGRKDKMQFDHIYIGPTPNINLSMSSLSRFLSRKNAAPSSGITYCDIPYRQW